MALKNLIYFVILFLFSFKEKEKIYVYYDNTINKSWFSNFSNYQIIYLKTKFKSNNPLSYIKSTKTKHYNFYLTNNTLFYNRFNIANYRIRGLSYLNKNNSVICIKNLKSNIIKKIIIHEFGHGKGLSHCVVKNCIMNDAKGRLSNLKNSNKFCKTCYLKIIKNSFFI